MKEILELTEKEGGLKVLIPINKVLSISQNLDNTCFVETSFDKSGDSAGFYTRETYENVRKMITSVIF